LERYTSKGRLITLESLDGRTAIGDLIALQNSFTRIADAQGNV
jgi:hypothetical protein